MKTQRILGAVALAAIALAFQQCKSSQSATADTGPPVSYTADIKPVMERSCTPCHFPEKGKKEMLDTYEAVAEYINPILRRVQLDPEDEKYMPFKSKKPALTAEEIDTFKRWAAQGTPE